MTLQIGRIYVCTDRFRNMSNKPNTEGAFSYVFSASYEIFGYFTHRPLYRCAGCSFILLFPSLFYTSWYTTISGHGRIGTIFLEELYYL